MILRRSGPLLLLVAALLAPAPARGSDPHLTWETLQTDHFRIHFHDGGRAFAIRAGRIAEEALAHLQIELGWKPADGFVHIACTDLGDGANGFARVQPYDGITLLAYAPEADTDLGRYDDWLRVLIYHELVHVLHLDQFGGVVGAINAVFGKTILPNLALPSWFIEGLATWVESRSTGSGRVGSAAFDMYLRVAALEGTLPTSIGGFTGAPLWRPGGTWAYAFGSHFLTWIERKYGVEAIKDFVHDYGRRLLPYGLNNVARATIGKDFVELFAEWRADLMAEVEQRAATIRGAGLIEGHRVTRNGQTHHAPVFSRSGQRLALSHTNGYEPAYMTAGPLSVDGKAFDAERLYQCWGGCGRAVWGLDDRKLYTVGGRWADPYRVTRDLLVFDLDERPHLPTRITRGLRGRELDLSPDGKRVVVVTARWGLTALTEVELATGAQRRLLDFSEELQLNQPRYLPNGELVFSAQAAGGWRDLYRLSVDGSREPLTSDPHREIGVAVAPDGTLYYSSDRTGIWNIEAMDPSTGRQWQVTRVLGGAFNPTVSADGRRLAYNGYHARGHDLYVVERDRARWTPLERFAGAAPPERYEPRPVPAVLTPYRASLSAWPRTWTPTLGLTAEGLSSVGLQLLGQDAVGQHAWGLTTDFQILNQDASVAVSYGYSGVRPHLNAFFARWPGSGLRYVADELETFHQENLLATLGMGVAIPHIEHPFFFSANLSYWRFFDPAPPAHVRHDPGSDQPFLSRDGHRIGFGLGWSYDHVESHGYSISPERGVRLGMSFDLFPAWLGNENTTWSMSWYTDGYVPIPWLDAHVLSIKYKGGVKGGAEGARGTFSLGGFPEQDLVTDLLNETGLFGAYLRGYPPGAFQGETFHQLQLEYRLPVLDLFTAPGTLPLWLRRLSAAVFSDVGLIYTDDLVEDSLKATVGAELRLTTELFYNIPYTLRLGYARAVTRPAGDQFFLIIGSNL